MLLTELVLTTKLAKALINAREVVEEAKRRTKNTRERLRKERKRIAITTKV